MPTHSFLRITFCFFCITTLLTPYNTYASSFRGRNIILKTPQKISTRGQIKLSLQLPKNHHFAEDVESSFKIFVKDGSLISFKPTAIQAELSKSNFPITFSYSAQTGETIIVIEARAFFCDDTNKVCLTDTFRYKFPIQIESGNNGDLNLSTALKSKLKRV